MPQGETMCKKYRLPRWKLKLHARVVSQGTGRGQSAQATKSARKGYLLGAILLATLGMLRALSEGGFSGLPHTPTAIGTLANVRT